MKLSKRKKRLSCILGGTLICASLVGCGVKADEVAVITATEVKGTEVSADEAIELLKEGNKRFVDGKTQTQNISDERKQDLYENGQYPYAVIVSCSDSRVPTELVFDEGLGSVFVIRNAGNVIDAVTLGSIEYGAEHLGTPLIVVLGHQNCGAVKATVEGGHTTESIEEIINHIKPAYESAKEQSEDENIICGLTEDNNIENSIDAIMESEVIKELVNENKLKVVGAKYSLEDGSVTFIEK